MIVACIVMYVRQVADLHCSSTVAYLLSSEFVAHILLIISLFMCSVDVTRVEQWIPLRENFALPFLWSQLAVLTIYFRSSLSPAVKVLSQLST